MPNAMKPQPPERACARRLIVGISGSSGATYGLRLLQALKKTDLQVHLVITPAGWLNLRHETGVTDTQALQLAHTLHASTDLAASIASGSFQTMGMIVAPCSMRTLAAIAHGLGDNLLTRTADVTLKERRRLVLMARETPLNLAHLDNMRRITEMGGIIFPPVPALYLRPQSIDELLAHSVGRALGLFGIRIPDLPHWSGGTPRNAGIS